MVHNRLKPITPRPHWQCNVKRSGTRRARLCCDGSKCAAPMLHASAPTHSSFVECPAQKPFCAIVARLNEKACGGDAKDACAHSPGSEIKTHVQTDDACAEWHEKNMGNQSTGERHHPHLGHCSGAPNPEGSGKHIATKLSCPTHQTSKPPPMMKPCVAPNAKGRPCTTCCNRLTILPLHATTKQQPLRCATSLEQSHNCQKRTKTHLHTWDSSKTSMGQTQPKQGITLNSPAPTVSTGS